MRQGELRSKLLLCSIHLSANQEPNFTPKRCNIVNHSMLRSQGGFRSKNKPDLAVQFMQKMFS